MHRCAMMLCAAVCAALLVPVTAVVSQAAPGQFTITVSGTDVGTYPAFDPAIARYAITTGEATAGTVSVAVTGASGVRVDGRRTRATTLTGLTPGDEIGIRADGSSYSFVYLPAGFPTLAATVDEEGLQPGYIALTLNKYANDDSPTFDTIIDRRGVPVWVEEEPPAGDLDLKQQPNGALTVMQPTGTGDELVTLDDHYRPVGSAVRTPGMDGHDSWLFADGRKILIASVHDPDTDRTDSVIRLFDAAGTKTFEWSTARLPDDESLFTIGSGDYAHINSVWPLPDGDVVASFRHFSAVLRIATTAHDGYEAGDVVWELGGRHSSFTFPDPGFEGGPCAQHTASDWTDDRGREHVLLFDDGSNVFSGSICLDPSNPSGPAIERPQTRITEYVLDPDEHTARMVWNYQVPGVSTTFAGSAYRMDNENTLIGWAATPHAIASEVSPSGELLWQLEDADAKPGYPSYHTYRAMLVDVPDRIEPVVSMTTPANGGTYPAFSSTPSDYSCSDRGGSGLEGCTVTWSGRAPGRHTMTITATDGAGNVTRAVRHFTLRAVHWPNVSASARGRHAGRSVHGSWRKQLLRVRLARHHRVKAWIRIVNDGTEPERLRLSGNDTTRGFAVRYLVAGRDRTRAITRGRFRTPVLAPGHKVVVKTVIRRLRRAHHGNHRTFHLTAISTHDGKRRDAAGVRVVAR